MKPKYMAIWAGNGLNRRTAVIQITNKIVTASSPDLSFMIGWHIEKVIEKVIKYGFHIKNTSSGPGTTYITERPTIEERYAKKKKDKVPT